MCMKKNMTYRRLWAATLLVVLSLITSTAFAQPAARRAQQAQKAQAKSNANNMTERAKIAFPTQQKMPEDVVWRRDLYRLLDLTKDENGGLYYPVEPVGSQMNLFTYLFKLMLSGQITAYKYNLNGNESFTPDAKIKPLEFLDNYSIYYEKKDGRLKIDNSDIPSREVKSYYIKESSYYDQYTATYHTKVVALCPIMTREDDFGGQANTYPLFWVKYDDIAPFLSKQMIMTSNINNAAMMSIDDFFVNYKELSLAGRDGAIAFEEATCEMFKKIFHMNVKHVGQIGNTPDIYVESDDAKYCGILDNKAYKNGYSLIGDHKRRMEVEYIPHVKEYGGSCCCM